MALIVFFGTLRQMRDYAQKKNLNPQRDLLLAGESVELRLMGFTGRIDIAGNYEGYNSLNVRALMRYIELLNLINGHTQKEPS